MNRVRDLTRRYGEMASDVAWSGISDFLALVVNLVSFTLLGRTLEVSTYGAYVGTYGIVGPLGALTWSGLSLLILQRIIREGDPAQLVANRSYSLTLVQGVAAVVAATLIGSQVISGIATSTIMLVATAELLLFPISQATATIVQATRGFAAAARLRILIPLVRLVALLALYFTDMLTVRNLALTWIIGFSLTAAGSILVVLPTLGFRFGVGKPSAAYLRNNLDLSLPMTASNLQINGDKVVMNSVGLEADAGLYGAAYRIVLMSQMPMKTMNQALFQRFLPDNVGDLGQHVRRAKRFSVVSMAMSLVICIPIFIFAPWLKFLVGDKFAESVSIVRWLLPVVPLLSISRAPINGLLGLGRTTLRAALILSSAALSMVLYIALIPSLSWRGAAFGTFASELYITLAGWYLLLRCQRDADSAFLDSIEEPAPVA